MQNTKDKIFKICVSFIKKHKVLPTRIDMLQAGIRLDMIRYHFGNMTSLQNEALKVVPKTIKNKKPLQNKEISVIYKLAGVNNVK